MRVSRCICLLAAGLVMAPVVAFADSTVTVRMAGEAFEGAPAFEVTMGGRSIGTGTIATPLDTVTEGRLYAAQTPARFVEEFVFTVSDDLFATDADIAVTIINDAFLDKGAGYDRNIFVESIEVNGMAVGSSALRPVGPSGDRATELQAGMLPVYEIGDMAVASPPATGWPATMVQAARTPPVPMPRPARFVHTLQH